MKEFKRVVDDIYILETPFGGVWSGIVLIMGDEKVLIDSGGDAKTVDNYLLPALRSMGLELNNIDLLLNTHCHGDHIGGHYRIKELADIETVCYKKSLEKLRDPLKYSKLIRAKYPEHSPLSPPVLLGVEADRVIDEGEMVAGRLRLIHTPGHDDDAVCWYDTKTKSIISGDSLQGNGTDSQGIALYMYLPDYLNSMSKLLEMDIENIITAHPYTLTGATALGRDKAKEYIRKCLEITEEYDEYIRALVREGVNDTAVIAESLIRHMGGKLPNKLFLSMYTVDEHMKLINNSS